MFTKTISARQLLTPSIAGEISLGDEIRYKEQNQIKTAEVVGCYENAEKFEVNN